MAITGFFGSLGSGKTLLANYFMQKELAKGREIVSHTFLKFPYTYMSIEKIFDKAISNTEFFTDKLLFMDEFHLIMESRRSSAGVNVDFSQSILIQLGKLDCDLYYTSQLLSQMDLRIKQMQKYFFFCKKTVRPTLARFDPDRRILKDLDTGELIPLDIDVEVIIQDGEELLNDGFVLPWELLQDLFKQYKTREIIKFDRKKYLKK